MPEELTQQDIRILKLLQEDATLSSVQVAEKVGMSQSPCWRRMERLKAEGYIKQHTVLLDRSKFGADLCIFAQLRIRALTDAERKKFRAVLQSVPEIVEAHDVFGEIDVILKILAYSVPWYQDFVFKVLHKLPGVVSVQSMITLGEMKYTTAIPLTRYPV